MKVLNDDEIGLWVEESLGVARSLALGGLLHSNSPCGIARRMIEHGIRGVTTYSSPAAGFDVDLLIGGGCVVRTVIPVVTFEFALAPNFRWAVEHEEIEACRIDVVSLVAGLTAGARGLPFMAVPFRSLAGSDVTKENPLIQGVMNLDGQPAYIVSPITPDVAILHADAADPDGNIYSSAVHHHLDRLLAYASKRVLVSVERLVGSRSWGPAETLLPANQVDAVVCSPRGAYPTSCGREYAADLKYIRRYADSMNEARRSEDRHVRDSLVREYLEIRTSTEDLASGVFGEIDAANQRPGAPRRHEDSGWSIKQLMAVVLARQIRDGEHGTAGAGALIPLAAMLLAKALHAPRLMIGGDIFVSPAADALYESILDDGFLERCAAVEGFEELFGYSNIGLDFFFYSGLQVDRFGNVNLHGVGRNGSRVVAGPGVANISFAANSERTFLYLSEHSNRTLVDKVDYVSVAGHLTGPSSKTDAGLSVFRGPSLLVTPLCTFEFDSTTLSAILKTIHPGVSVEEVVASTGFQIDLSQFNGVTPVPTSEELAVLRRIDPAGLLRDEETVR